MRRNKKYDQFWDSAKLNKDCYQYYVERLTDLAIGSFEWKGLPETVDARFLELTLFNNGMAVFFKDDVLGFLGLQTMIGGNLDVYRIPKERTAYAVNGYHQKLDESNSVIVFNNLMHTNSISAVEFYARKLYNVDRTIDVNITAQKTPTLILCDENQRLTMKNLYMQYDGNQPFIFGGKDLDINGIKSLRTDAPLVAGELMDIKNAIWNEALTYLGISNINVTKKERLISDEVQRNAGGIIASRFSRLTARQQACDMINSMFGLNVSVDFRKDYTDLVDKRELDDEDESEESEESEE